MNSDFYECEKCAAKPGSPALCESCLHNRNLIHRLQQRKPNVKLIVYTQIDTTKVSKSLLTSILSSSKKLPVNKHSPRCPVYMGVALTCVPEAVCQENVIDHVYTIVHEV